MDVLTGNEKECNYCGCFIWEGQDRMGDQDGRNVFCCAVCLDVVKSMGGILSESRLRNLCTKDGEVYPIRTPFLSMAVKDGSRRLIPMAERPEPVMTDDAALAEFSGVANITSDVDAGRLVTEAALGFNPGKRLGAAALAMLTKEQMEVAMRASLHDETQAAIPEMYRTMASSMSSHEILSVVLSGDKQAINRLAIARQEWDTTAPNPVADFFIRNRLMSGFDFMEGVKRSVKRRSRKEKAS